MPAADTTAVPPAEISGCKPNPSVDPTETITPPTGTLEVFTSYPTVAPIPEKVMLVIPALSVRS